jgi:hypothetical protein
MTIIVTTVDMLGFLKRNRIVTLRAVKRVIDTLHQIPENTVISTVKLRDIFQYCFAHEHEKDVADSNFHDWSENEIIKNR